MSQPVFRAFLAVLLGLLVGNVGAAPRSVTYPALGVKVRAVQLAAHSYYIPGLAGAASTQNEGFMSNAGFVVTPAGVVVFDTLGSPSLAQAMVKQIRKATRQPIKIVIISHYHADHYYGMQVFEELGAEVWAHESGKLAVGSEEQKLRFEQRKEILGRWINDKTQRFPEPTRWLSGDTDFELGGVHFNLRMVGPAHSPEDMAMFVQEDKTLFSGDLVFKGRVPFLGEADSRQWLAALDRLIAFDARFLVPGHGAASSNPAQDLTLTRDYLRFVRAEMGQAVQDMLPFEDAYLRTDWSHYEHMPAFIEANRRNAYNTYLLMEREMLAE
jgi:glyoxylase-like metal-dependent hydrolase (beta-lactamase superfamily II)